MKKNRKKDILILIVLLILIIVMLRAFIKSRANKIIEITAYCIDNSSLLSEETLKLDAINEGESGVAITLPSYINTKKVKKYIITQKSIIQEEITEETEDKNVNEKIDMLPGEKIYLTQDELENLEVNLAIEYDTVEIENQILYNKKLELNDEEYEILSVSGYMPNDTEMEVNEFENINIEELSEKYPNYSMTGNYNIKLISNEKQYIPKDYEQILNVEISIISDENSYKILEIQSEEENDEINQNANIIEIENVEIGSSKIKFSTEKINTYLILEKSTFLNEEITDDEENTSNEETSIEDNIADFPTTIGTKIEKTELKIDDYESDKNYYIGLNYTENMSKKNSGKYTESNLKEVKINYYGYDYDLTEIVVPKEYDITLNATAKRTTSGSVTQSNSGGGGGPNNRTYKKTDTITCTISGINELKQQYSNLSSDSSWTMEIAVPNTNFSSYFNSASSPTNGVSVNVANNLITITGSNMTDIMNSTSDTWSFTFTVTFQSTNRNNLNNISYTTLTVNSCKSTIVVGDYTPYATISDTEQYNLLSYKKCVPVDSNGNVTISLIDNPFMNRPLKRGFNGWKTNDSKYANNITTNSNTYEQTLTTNISNITESDGSYVINLYPDWIEANVVFVSSSGSGSNSGTSPNSPINNSWTNINTIINSNIKNCTNASSREVNIIVLMNGTLDISGVTGPSTPYTLTSLYDGTNYGSSSTYLNVGDTDIYLDSDLQLDYIYTDTSKSYTSPSYSYTTDGTSAVTPCIYGNMYNLRIGRGIVSTNSNYCSFAQVQGGYYNRSSSEYKLVIESGQYFTIQLYRAGSSSTSTTSNAKLVVGCDIDRINNNNSNLKVYNRMASRTTSATCNPYNNGIAVDMNIKSGTIGVDYFNSEDDDDNSERNYAGVYVGGHGSTGYDKSNRYLLVEGGNIANIIGGLDMSESDMYKTYMYIKGGNIFNITGGAGYTHTYGDRIIQVTGGCVKYSISGGSNGVAASSDRDNGQLTGISLIYVGGNAHIGASYTLDQNGNKVITETSSSEVLYGVNAGTVCGGANGNSSYAGQTDGSYIIIDGNAVIHNNVFGGGNYGVMGASGTDSGSPVIELKNETSNFQTNTEYLITTSTSGENGLSVSGTSFTNETISTASVPSDSSKWIFENASGTQYYIKNSSTNQYIYVSRTSNSWGSTTATVTLSETNKTAFNVSGTSSKTISCTSGTNTLYLKYSNGWTISSNSNWGGSSSNNSLYLLTYEKLPEDVIEDAKTIVNIKIYGGNIKNNIYGGANRNSIYGTVEIDMTSGKVDGTMYGGSNIKGTIEGASLIDISGGTLGNATSEDTIFGGGLGSDTNVKGRVLLNINETNNNTEIYGNIYGGSSQGKISNDIEINIQDIPTTTNTLNINGSVFGAGKGYATSPADVSGNININVDGSDLNKCNIFGGSNLAGTINGIITINIGETYKSTIKTIYGGGNQASIGTETQGVYVYLLNNANIGSAFNGGKSADLISSDKNDVTRGIYLRGGTAQNIYGGSDTSGTVTVSHVYIESGNATNVYGGNNQGGTTTVTNISITGGMLENIYGGGEKAETETSNIITTGGSASYIYGGGNQAGVKTTNIETKGGNIGNIFGGANVSGDVENSYVTTNDANNGDEEAGLTMNVTATAYDATWENQNNPEYITNAKINVKFTNNTAQSITKWNATLFAQDSILRTNYSSSEILENNGIYTFTEQNKYWGTNEIPAGGTFNIEFEILTKQKADEFSIGYEIQGQDSNGNSANYSKSIIGTVYGGNNQGGTTKTTNVTINGGGVSNVYGGGNQAVTNETNVNINGEVGKNIFGGGNQAGVNTNTNVNLIGATVGDNVYGGGNQGTVTQNTYVHVKNSILKNSLYAGGNGISAIVFGNVNLTMEGSSNQVTNNVFGGGNQAETGTEEKNDSTSTVNIVGGNIGKNVYGGANTSVVYGTTQTNIGYDAVGDTSLEIGDIYIGGTIFGGGEANASGSEVYDFSFISVTKGIDIQINGNGHNKLSIKGSIFGSGNASSTSGKSYINIQNYGTADNPQNNISIQRANCATISNSAISLSGTTDRTNEYSSVFFSLSRVDQIRLKNNSILYLCNGANLLKNLDSLVDNNGKEETAKVTIDSTTGEISEKNVDNRIYMLEGKNLNVATNEQATAYGQVHGMIFLGLFTNRVNPSTSTGLYHQGYNNGDEITNAGTFSSNSYVMAQHMTSHDITIDGFYTNYNKEGKIKTDYVDTTPKDDVYYIWLVGEEFDVTKFEVSLTASKYATLGTYELLLQGFSDPNLKFSLSGFSAGLSSEISLVNPDEIKAIEPDDERANNVYGLTMKTGNIGWQSKGTTKFLTQNGGSYIGENDYTKDNSTSTPTLNLCFYHSENLTKKQALGDVKIRLQVLKPVDDLNYELSYIDIIITLSSALYQDDFFEAAITPGQEYGLFTTTETTITAKSAFSTYYSLYIEDFLNSKYVKDYETYNRVIVSRDSNSLPYTFPENTKITMLDMVTNKYYYYIVTAEDVSNEKYIYNLSDFIAMGSNDNKFDESIASKEYYINEKNLIYENFIFHINFADSSISNDIKNNSLLMELRDNEGETLIGVLGIQRDSMVYTVYNQKEATIELDGDISPETLYLGKTLNLNVKTTFTQTILDSKTIYDTQYFDQKLGIKISIYDNNRNHLNLDSLFGINFELDGQVYYPRVDGTTRICIADKVTDVLAKIKMNTTGNNTLPTGDYTLEIESFGSPDGIYYGLTASDKISLNVRIINSAYGLKVITMDSNKIIDKETGKNEKDSNTLVSVVKYSSKLSNPSITVSLYRRDYTEEYSQEYTLVDFQDYVIDTLTTTNKNMEYAMSESTPMQTSTNYYNLKTNLITGTYKLVYKLYDENTYVGEAFDYIIIK